MADETAPIFAGIPDNSDETVFVVNTTDIADATREAASFLEREGFDEHELQNPVVHYYVDNPDTEHFVEASASDEGAFPAVLFDLV